MQPQTNVHIPPNMMYSSQGVPLKKFLGMEPLTSFCFCRVSLATGALIIGVIEVLIGLPYMYGVLGSIIFEANEDNVGIYLFMSLYAIPGFYGLYASQVKQYQPAKNFYSWNWGLLMAGYGYIFLTLVANDDNPGDDGMTQVWLFIFVMLLINLYVLFGGFSFYVRLEAGETALCFEGPTCTQYGPLVGNQVYQGQLQTDYKQQGPKIDHVQV
mmetsp:Transcript_6259/g.7065  ORF Transcript_6259/g.7065 Transcript_6259/m.7065 type:complete len:213 (+) Transcript_6259:58-696(+)